MQTFLNLLQNGIVMQTFGAYYNIIAVLGVLAALISYALGSLNFAVIISKKMYKDDIRNYGSKNAGMTNMLRTYGTKAALLTILGDMLKTVLAIVIGMLLVGRTFGGNYIGGLFAIIGHVYPVYFGFRGGKGVVTAATTILMLNPLAFLLVLAVFVITVACTRYISLGSILGACVYPFAIYLFTNSTEKGFAMIFALCISAFVIFLHRANLKRLANGKESKMSFKKKENKEPDNKE